MQVFTVGCLSVAPILAYLENVETAPAKIFEYFTDPAMCAGFSALLLTILATGKWNERLSPKDRRRGLWYLMNGAFIHITMDG